MDHSARSIGLALAPKIPAFLSMCGSLLTVIRVLSDADRRKKTMHRIMVGMGTVDFLVSIWYFAGTWAIPKGTPSMFGDGDTEIFWAAGDESGISCSFAGFVNQFIVASMLYNVVLSVFFLLLSYGWKEARIAKIEWIFHTIPVVFGLSTSIFAAVGDLYGQVEWTCWINPEEQDTTIKNNVQVIRWTFLFGIVWIVPIFQIIAFALLYRKMRSIEDATIKRYMTERRSGKPRFSFHAEDIVVEDIVEEEDIIFSQELNNEGNKISGQGGSNEHINREEVIKNELKVSFQTSGIADEEQQRTIVSTNTNSHGPSTTSTFVLPGRSGSKKVAIQGLFYLGAYYIAWFFPTASRITELVRDGKNYYLISVLDAAFLSLQGFLNFLVYFRPDFLKHRKENKDDGLWKSFKSVVIDGVHTDP